MSALQLARYRFSWRVTSPLQLPPYASSTLRGVFGRALRQQACLLRRDSCQGCGLLASCPYPALFEPQSLPRPRGAPPALSPYAIETAFSAAAQPAPRDLRLQPGQSYAFDMVLMTPQANAQLPLIASTWQQAFAKGVGKGNGQAALLQVQRRQPDGQASSLYRAGQPAVSVPPARLDVPVFAAPADVTLQFESPLRIESQGRLIRSPQLSAGLFLRHLIRRVSYHLESQQPGRYPLELIHHLNAQADRVGEGERQLRWCDWERYSSRQGQKMKLGGLIGQWQLLHVPAELLPLIYLGQWLHVGKESAFGLGKYRWSNAQSGAGAQEPGQISPPLQAAADGGGLMKPAGLQQPIHED